MSKDLLKKGKDLVGKFKFSGFSASLLGSLSVNFDFETKAEQREKLSQSLKELYILRNNLTYFYFTYYSLEELSFAETDNELEKELMDGCFIKAFEVYSNISDTLMGSEYFMLLDKNERIRILRSFDYVKLQETLMEHDEDHYLNIEEQREIVEELLTLYDKIDDQIDKFNSML